MINFKSICYKNFISSGNYNTYIKLDNTDLTVIVGKNGAGKSTILDAISFVLFNKPFRNINKNQLINSITKKNCLVEIEFTVDNDSYLIKRGIKPNVFEIYKNNVLVPQDSRVGDYQEYLERSVLRCNHKAFCQVVVLGSANYIPFLDLPAADRRKVVENILDLEIFSIMNANLKKLIIETKEKLDDAQNKKFLLVSEIKTYHEFETKAKEDQQTLIDSYQENIDKIQKQIDECSTKIQKVEQDSKLAEKKAFYQNEYNNIKKNIILLQSNIDTIDKELEFFEMHNVECPTCMQRIDKDFRIKFIDDRNQSKNSKIIVLEQAEKSIKECHDFIKEIENVESKIQEEIDRQRKISQFIENKKNEIQTWKKAILSATNKTVEKDETNINYDEKNNELQKVNVLIDEIEREKNAQIVLLRMLKDDGIKAKIIEQYIDMINELVNKYLLEMDFICQFHLDGEFNETIKSRYRDEFTFASFSQGEKMRITLAILFTWRELARRRNSISTNILFFDEILDSSMDQEGIDYFLKIIKNLTKGSNTFIISHNYSSIDNIDNVLEFEKIKGYSHLISPANK